MNVQAQNDQRAVRARSKWLLGLTVVGIATVGTLFARPDRAATEDVAPDFPVGAPGTPSGGPARSHGVSTWTQHAPEPVKETAEERAVTEASAARARAALEAVLPEWDQSINVTPEGLKGKQFDPHRYDPLELAKKVTDEQFEFRELRDNGRSVFRSADQQSTVKHDDRLGYWKFIGPMKASEEGVMISDAEAASKTRQLLSDFELPDGELGEVRAAGIAGMAQGDDTPQIMGRHVRVSREINGITVDESTLMVSYDGAGNVMRAERRWPTFELSGEQVASRDQALSDLTQDLQDDFARDEGLETGASLHYALNEETGVHEPVLRVQVRSSESHGRTLDYSLVQHGTPSVPSGDDQDG